MNRDRREKVAFSVDIFSRVKKPVDQVPADMEVEEDRVGENEASRGNPAGATAMGHSSDEEVLPVEIKQEKTGSTFTSCLVLELRKQFLLSRQGLNFCRYNFMSKCKNSICIPKSFSWKLKTWRGDCKIYFLLELFSLFRLFSN